MTVALPEGYTTRPPTLADVEPVVALINAYYASTGDPPSMTADELRRDWHTIDLAEEALLIYDDAGRLVAQADILSRTIGRSNVYIHVPPHPHQMGLWAYLIRWGERWTVDQARRADDVPAVEIHHFVRSTNQAAIELLQATGYGYVRTHYIMETTLKSPPLPAEWPTGIGVRSYRPGEDDDVLFLAGEESFQDMWNRPPSTKERWLAPTSASGFDPSLWFLPVDEATATVIGVCLCSVMAGNGEVDTVGIRRPWRKQGVGLAVLRHALGEFYHRGITTVGLNVDGSSPTGAPRLYKRAGFTVQQSVDRYVKEMG